MSIGKIGWALILCLSYKAEGQSLRDAKKYIWYQRYQTAINQLKALHKKEPANLPVTYWLGIAYLENDAADSAVSLFSDSTIDTSNPLIIAGRAEVLAAAGDPAGARQQFNVRVLQPAKINDALTAMAMGRALSRLNDFQQAEYFLDRSFTLRDDPDVLMILAENADKKRKDDDAVSFAKDALALQPKYAPAWYFLAQQSLKQKDTSATMAYLTKTIEADSLFMPAWRLKYRVAWQQRSRELSNDYLHYLALSDPDSARILALAPVYYNAGRYDEVLTLVQQAQGNGASVSPALYRYAAYSDIQLHRYPQAFDHLTTYAKLTSPLSLTDSRLLALLAARLYPQYPKALPYIEQAYDAETDTVYRRYYNQVLQQAYQHQPDKVLAWQMHRLRSGKDITDWIQMVMNEYRAGNNAFADSIAAGMTKRFPDQADGWYLRAYIASGKQHQTATAKNIPWLENFVQTGSRDSTTSKNKLIAACSLLVNWYQGHQQHNKALLYLRTWSQLAPENKSLQQQIRRWQ